MASQRQLQKSPKESEEHVVYAVMSIQSYSRSLVGRAPQDFDGSSRVC